MQKRPRILAEDADPSLPLEGVVQDESPKVLC
jgi:hypothetical protein